MLDFDYLMDHIQEQYTKRQYLNAISAANDLQRLLLKEFNSVLKGQTTGMLRVGEWTCVCEGEVNTGSRCTKCGCPKNWADGESNALERRVLEEKSESTHWAKIYVSGPIEVAKQIIRKDVLREGLCVTIEPTLFIYTGGEEIGYVVGLVNYPRFPSTNEEIKNRAKSLALLFLNETYQHSVMIMMPDETIWLTKRQQ